MMPKPSGLRAPGALLLCALLAWPLAASAQSAPGSELPLAAPPMQLGPDEPVLLAQAAPSNPNRSAKIQSGAEEILAQIEMEQRASAVPDEAPLGVVEPRPRVFDLLEIIGGVGTLPEQPAPSPMLGSLFRDRFNASQLSGRHLNLTPYVPDRRWFEAMALMRDNRCDEAWRLAQASLGSRRELLEREPAVQYAMARMQMCGAAGASGRRTMEQLAQGRGPVADLARKRLGMRQRANEEGAAEEESGMYLSQRLAEARERARRGQLDAVLADLEVLRHELSSSEAYKVRSVQARLLEDAGRKKEAVEVYRLMYRMGRAWRSGEKVEQEIEAAEARLKKTVIPFGDRVDRVVELVEAGRYTEAHEVSKRNVKLRGVTGEEVNGWAAFRNALQAEREKNREYAVRKFEEANRLIKDRDVRPRNYMGWARALRRVDRDVEAIALYERLCDEFAQHELCGDAIYEAGRLHQYQNDHERARHAFARVIDQHPDSPNMADALWRNALSAYLQGEYSASIGSLKVIVERHAQERDSSELTIGLKARYWIGAAYMKMGKRTEGIRALQDAHKHGPLTWYGQLAVARLTQAGVRPEWRMPEGRMTEADLRDLSALLVPNSPRLAVAGELARLGMWREALGEVRNQATMLPIPEGTHRLRAALHLANNEPNWSHWLMKRHIAESGPTTASLRDWGTAFPVDYIDLAHRWGSQYGVSPFLVQAIIRQESGFRVAARSPVGATGLMQLMPATARNTAKAFMSGESYKEADLLVPNTNVRLGTMYIRVHTAHAADQVPLALAGYNAGMAPMKTWFERYGDRELDAWVESITYQETRGYVRKVMTSYITYAALYGGAGQMPEISLQLPERLGAWGRVPGVASTVTAGESMAHLDHSLEGPEAYGHPTH